VSKKIFEYWFNKIKDSDISERNKELLMKLSEHMLDIDLSYARARFFLAKLWVIIHIVNKDLDKLTEDDIKELMRTLKDKIITYGEKEGNYTPHTLFGYKEVIRKFYQWLEGYEWKSKEFPKKVSWIKMSMKRNEQRLPEEILIKEEILRMVEYCPSFRNKTLIIMLWESDCRINELLNIRLKDIDFDDYGLTVVVSGKTGTRKLRLVTSVPYVSMWLKEKKKRLSQLQTLRREVEIAELLRDRQGAIVELEMLSHIHKLKKKLGKNNLTYIG